MPFFMFTGLVGLWKCFTVFGDNSLTLHEVRLKKDGLHAEISLLDWFGRVRKNQKFTVEIRDLNPPPVYPESVPLKGDLFPHMVEVFEIKSEDPKLPWIKYYDIVRKKFLIPKDYAYMDRELMVAVMNGYYVKTQI